MPARQSRRFHGNEGLRPAARIDPVNLDEAKPALRDFRGNGSAHRVDVPRQDRGRRDVARNPRRVRPDNAFVLAVIVAADFHRRSQHVIDRLTEPQLRAAANQFAADEQDENRRDDRQPEQGHHQLCAEARERQPAAALDKELDDVPGEEEDQRQDHRQVRG